MRSCSGCRYREPGGGWQGGPDYGRWRAGSAAGKTAQSRAGGCRATLRSEAPPHSSGTVAGGPVGGRTSSGRTSWRTRLRLPGRGFRGWLALRGSACAPARRHLVRVPGGAWRVMSEAWQAPDRLCSNATRENDAATRAGGEWRSAGRLRSKGLAFVCRQVRIRRVAQLDPGQSNMSGSVEPLMPIAIGPVVSFQHLRTALQGDGKACGAEMALTVRALGSRHMAIVDVE